MSDTHLRRLFEHMEWADAKVGAALLELVDPPAEILGLYAHVLAAEIVWLDRVEGRAASVTVWPAAERAECVRLARAASERRATLLAALSTAELARRVRYTTSDGRTFETPFDEILLHVALHGTFHRGQIATLLRGAGVRPVSTDFIEFVRGAAAARRFDDKRR